MNAPPQYRRSPLSAESWLRAPRNAGLELSVEYRSGNQSSQRHLPSIGAWIGEQLNCNKVFPGSLNFHAAEAVAFPEPARIACEGHQWLFVPVVIADSVVGVAARRPPAEALEFIEVFACDHISRKLGLTFGDELSIRLLPGHYFQRAA